MGTISQFFIGKRLTITLLTLFTLISAKSFGKEKRFESAPLTGTQIEQTGVIDFVDPELNVPNVFSDTYSTFIELKIDDNTAPFYWYKYKVRLRVTPKLPDGTDDASYDIEMLVENNRYGGFGMFTDFQTHEILNRKGARIEVMSVTTENIDSSQTTSVTPANVSLKLVLLTNRYYLLSEAVPLVTPQMTDDGSQGFLQLNWTEITGAEEYELEWTWVDKFGTNLNAYLSPDEIDLTEREFELNNTRVHTLTPNFNIPCVYSEGYIVFRVRAIGRWVDDPNDYSKKYFGKWSYSVSPPVKLKVSDWQYVSVKEHEAGKNWQFQASYAEGGKKKEISSYFDGSLRNRQTVTRISTEDKAIVGEVIYDEEGRAAVEVLPVPLETEKNLKFYKDINKNNNSLVYSYQDLDPQSGENCVVTPEGMSTESGASKYYSKNNANTGNFQDFVPDAERYPFSQIKYTNDNTGRVKIKGGVGTQFQLGQSHEMKYFYAIPSQEELNRLFGYSVGNVSHYKKNTVVDPNGQVSVSYVDPQGRTIATALAAGNPQSLESLPDELNNSLHLGLETDLLGKASPDDVDTNVDFNVIFSTGTYGNLNDGLRYDGQKALLEQTTTYDFLYSLNKKDPFTFLCNGKNYRYPFVYDLNIDITNDCGESLKRINKTVGDYTVNSNGVVTLVAAGTSTATNESLDLVNPPLGAYGISKKLVVNSTALEAFVNDYIRRGVDDGCIFRPEAPKVDTSGCFTSCDDCVKHYTGLSYEGYTGMNAYVQQMLASNYDLLQLDPTSQEYNDLLELLSVRYKREFELIIIECNKPCEVSGTGDGGTSNGDGDVFSSTGLDNIVTSLLDDMKPTGQYGLTQTVVDEETGIAVNQADGADISTMPWSIYNVNNDLYAPVEGIEDPNNVSWKTPYYFYDIDGQSPGADAYKHYFTPTGEIDYVFVNLNEDGITFTPPIDPATPSANMPILIDGTLHKVEPHYLEDVNDFIAAFQDHWAYSLIKFHPEFHYLDYKYAEAGITTSFNNGNVVVNSDGFDSYISSFTTYAQAVSAGLFANNEAVLDKDPYFLLTQHPRDSRKIDPNTSPIVLSAPDITSTDYATYKRAIMEKALSDGNGTNGSFENSGMSMFRNMYNSVACGSPDGSCSLPTSATFSDVITEVNGLAVEDQDLFWKYYVSYYLGMKQKIQHVFTNMYAFQQGMYNDCIGTDGSQNINIITSVISNYPTERTAIDALRGNAPAVTLHSVNNSIQANLVGAKAKRFLPYDESYDSEENTGDLYSNLLNDANYEYLNQTGICPMLRDLQIFLNGASKKEAMNDVFKGQANNLQTGMNFFTYALFTELGGTFPNGGTLKVSSNLDINNVSITNINFTQTSNAGLTGTHISLTIPAPNTVTYPSGVAPLTWAGYGTIWKVDHTSPAGGMTQIAYTGYNATTQKYNFKILVKVRHTATNQLFDVVFDGTTEARIACSLNPMHNSNNPNGEDPLYVNGPDEELCTKKQDFANALKDLINGLREAGDINTPQDLMNNTLFTNSYLNYYYNVGPNTQVTWYANGFFWITVTEGNITSNLAIQHNGSAGDVMNMISSYPLLNFIITENYSETFNSGPYKQNIILVFDTPNGPLNYPAYIDMGRGHRHLFYCCTDCSNLDNNNNGIGNGCDLTGEGCYNPADWDCDGVPNEVDTCPYKPNATTQNADLDGDGIPDACDECNNLIDADCDKILDTNDNCPTVYNYNQRDADGDGVGDVCDSCPNNSSASQGSCIDSILCMSQSDKDTFENGLKDLLNTIISNQGTNGSNAAIQQASAQFVTDNSLQQRFQQMRDDYPMYFSPQTVYLSQLTYQLSYGNLPTQLFWSGANYTNGNQYQIYMYSAENNSALYQNGNILNVTEVKLTQDVGSFDRNLIIKGNLVNGGTFAISSVLRFQINNGYQDDVCYFFGLGSALRMASSGKNNLRIADEKSFTTTSTPPSQNNNFGETCLCLPQQVVPLSATNIYPLYVSTMNNLNPGESVPFTYEQFSGLHLQYIYYGWVDYLTTLGITNVSDPRFITLPDFGDTQLNYGYNDYQSVIDAYEAQLTNAEPILNWSDFVDKYLMDNPGICPPKPLIPEYNLSVEMENPCQTMLIQVAEAYNEDAYNAYIESKKDEFRRLYLEDALGLPIEKFMMRYSDKEYQYTLYYYDQAGNLTQTVPPQGVKRFEAAQMASVNQLINNFRNSDSENDNPPLLPTHELETKYAYNSLNQLVVQNTPDGGSTRFAYDKLGRIVASQNDKQKVVNKFSYTCYDRLGRITEAGQMAKVVVNMSINENGKLVDGSNNLIDVESLDYPYNVSDYQEEVTYTQYDAYAGYEDFLQSGPYNVRNRVAVIFSFNEKYVAGPDTHYDNYIAYDYDIHGNVREMIQVNERINVPLNMDVKKKRINYEYDLISGNVVKVTLQKNRPDQFIHQYFYDADNRITNVKTSKDGIVWENDAKYYYYQHGPLARVIVGDKEVQGIDYAYTLQGWLKVVNAENMTTSDNDMGRDGKTGTASAYTAKDAFGFSLSYFRDDYKPRVQSGTNFFEVSNGIGNGNELFNGNISRMITSVRDTEEKAQPAQANNYAYDQLNRIMNMKGFRYQDNKATSDIESNYSYDRNGNLLTLYRTAPEQSNIIKKMDDFSYEYYNGTNQLRRIKDAVGANAFDVDIDDQPEQNYHYDEIGQLIKDEAEGLDIEWRVDGKVKRVTTANGNQIVFQYDGLGNRISKWKVDNLIFDGNESAQQYVRDAQGNVLGVYNYFLGQGRNNTISYSLNEHHIYGSSRLGLEKDDRVLARYDGRLRDLRTDMRPGMDLSTTALTLPPVMIERDYSLLFDTNTTATWVEPTMASVDANSNKFELNTKVNLDVTNAAQTTYIGQVEYIGQGSTKAQGQITLTPQKLVPQPLTGLTVTGNGTLKIVKANSTGTRTKVTTEKIVNGSISWETSTTTGLNSNNRVGLTYVSNSINAVTFSMVTLSNNTIVAYVSTLPLTNPATQNMYTPFNPTVVNELKISRQNGVINYYLNNTIIATYNEPTVSQTSDMLGYISMNQPNATVDRFRLMGETTQQLANKTRMQLFVIRNMTNNTYSPQIKLRREVHNGAASTFEEAIIGSNATVTAAAMQANGMEIDFNAVINSAANPIQPFQTSSLKVNGSETAIPGTFGVPAQLGTQNSSTSCNISGNSNHPGKFSVCYFNYAFGKSTGGLKIEREFSFNNFPTNNVAITPSTILVQGQPVKSVDNILTATVTPTSKRQLGPCLSDSDGDGIYDLMEDLDNDGNLANNDTDQDGTPDYLDTDDDGDTILTSYEIIGQTTPGFPFGTPDYDSDSVRNYLDSDDDNDGYPTSQESPNAGTMQNPGTPVNPLDSDGDGKPDYLDIDTSIAEPTRDISRNDYYRLVGDKYYELSNHLGNVLTVITDRKIIDKDIKHDYFNEFNEKPWQRYRDASTTLYNGTNEVRPQGNESGAQTQVFMNQGETYHIQLFIDMGTYPAGSQIRFALRDLSENILTDQVVTTTGVYGLSYTSGSSTDYLVTVSIDNLTFYGSFFIDNFSIYNLVNNGNDFASLFKPDVITYNDYYPFGMLVPNRHANTPRYRYGFNGMELDDELKGEGNSYITDFREYDPRQGRFTSIDPAIKKYPQFSPYSMCFNNPIYFKDTHGDDPITAIGEAAISFGLSVGLDYLSARILEQLSHEQAMTKINWTGAAYNAGETYVISTFFNGAGTARVINKIRRNKMGKIALEVANEMKDILIDNYTNGNYDDAEGDFDMDKFLNKEEMTTLFYQVLARRLVKYGYEKAAKSVQKSLDKASRKRDRLQEKYDKAIDQFNNASGRKQISRKAKKMQKAGKKLAKAENKVSNLEQSKQDLDNMLNSDLINGITNKVADKVGSEAAKGTIIVEEIIYEGIVPDSEEPKDVED